MDESYNVTEMVTETGRCKECEGPDDHGGDQGEGGSPIVAGWCVEAPAGGELTANNKETPMFWTIATLLAFPWLLGLAISCTVGGVRSPREGGRPNPSTHRDR